MSRPPITPKIYHISHVDNLSAIVAAGGLRSDAVMVAHGGPAASIGMGEIKQRRLELPVKCHLGDRVGEYVPFYFCPRSIMLYLLHMANHPNLTYKGGQGPIIHFEAELTGAVEWAAGQSRRWAFTLSNAGAGYAEFRNNLGQLDEIDWSAVASTDFRDPQVKEGKQAEFLVRDFFPWALVRRIGVHSAAAYSRVVRAIADAPHRPIVEVRADWYY